MVHDDALDGVANRVSDKDVALLDPRRLPGRHSDEHIDEAAHTPA
jgi:hypothetical protein